MHPSLKRFFLIFCLIGMAVCVFLAISNASASPAATSTAVMFGVVGAVLAVGAIGLRSRREI